MSWYPLLMALIAMGCLYFAGRGGKREWTGSPRTTEADRLFLWNVEMPGGRNRRAIASRMGISASVPFMFAVEEERWTHRFSKALGFCEEFQTQDGDFDRKAYILSDNRMFQERLGANWELHRLITGAFAGGAKKIYSTPRHLIVQLRKVQMEPPPEADALAGILNDVRKHLSGASSSTEEAQHGPPLAAQLYNALIAFLFIGGFMTFLLSLVFGYKIIDWQPFAPMLLHSSAALFAGLLIVMWLLLHRSAYGHEALMKYLSITSWAIVLFCASALWFINCHYDTASGPVYVESVREKYISHGRRSRIYNIRTANWRGPDKPVTFSVPSGMYSHLQVGDRVRVYTHPGYLGMEWVAKVEQVER